jgi:hypothetical protein
MTGEEEIQMSMIERVARIQEKFDDITLQVHDNLSQRKYFVKQWYEKSATDRRFYPGDKVLVLLPSDFIVDQKYDDLLPIDYRSLGSC